MQFLIFLIFFFRVFFFVCVIGSSLNVALLLYMSEYLYFIRDFHFP